MRTRLQRLVSRLYTWLGIAVDGRGPGLALAWGLLLLLACSTSVQSQAAEWSIQPSLTTKGFYNSNLNLFPAKKMESYGYGVAPTAEFAGKTERLEVSGKVGAEFLGYSGRVNTQLTNVYVPLAVHYRTEKDVWGFTGGLTRDNTLLSELQATGVAVNFTQRNLWTANPTWTTQLTEKLSWQLGAQFSYTTYERDLTEGNSRRLVDNRVVGGSGGFLYQLTERDQLQLTGVYAEFQTFGADNQIRASFPGVTMSVTHKFDESLTGTVYGGPKFLSSTTEGGVSNLSSSSTVWIGGGSISKYFERASIQASITRDLMPSGFGLLITTNRAEATGSYQLSETVTCSLNVMGAITSSGTELATGGIFSDRKYVSLKPSVAWKFHEWWEADVSYMYRRLDFDLHAGEPESTPHLAESHAALFMLTYYPPKFSISR